MLWWIAGLLPALLTFYQVCTQNSPAEGRVSGAVALTRRAGSGGRGRIATVDFLLDGASFLGRRDPVAALRAALAPVRGGAVELMAHPGFSDDPRRGAAEVALLTDPHLRAMLDDLGITLVHYGQLAALQRSARSGNGA